MKSILYFIILFLLSACSYNPQEDFNISEKLINKNNSEFTLLDSQENDSLIRTIEASYSQTFSDDSATLLPHILACQLAGITPLSKNKNLSETTIQEFLQNSKVGWSNLYQYVLSPLKKWRDKYMHKMDAFERIFYPFGGPDATYVTQLFPKAREYILVGLETIGSQESALSLLENDKNLLLLNESMKTFFKKGYFVTDDMAKQLSTRKAIGVTPLIILQLSKLGFIILKISEGSLDEQGKPLDNKNGIIKFVRIEFKDSFNGLLKELIYLKCKLDNKNKYIIDILFKFISKKNFITFIKSASYALHNQKNFSQTHNFILHESSSILQDDTGIPYKALKKYHNIHLFGYYEKPTLKIFSQYMQQDLSDIYKKEKPDELPFRLGYGCLFIPSNMIWAQPKCSCQASSIS